MLYTQHYTTLHYTTHNTKLQLQLQLQQIKHLRPQLQKQFVNYL